jgi:hypothetical protein
MTKDDIRYVTHKTGLGKRYGYWMEVMDYRPDAERLGYFGRLGFIKYIENLFGPIGIRWQYQKLNHSFIIKFNSEQDLIFFLLKIKQH